MRNTQRLLFKSVPFPEANCELATGDVLEGFPLLCGQEECYIYDKNSNAWKFLTNTSYDYPSRERAAIVTNGALFVTGT